MPSSSLSSLSLGFKLSCRVLCFRLLSAFLICSFPNTVHSVTPPSPLSCIIGTIALSAYVFWLFKPSTVSSLSKSISVALSSAHLPALDDTKRATARMRGDEEVEDLFAGVFDRGAYVARLKELNAAAEKIFFYNKMLIVVDEQLNGIRMALGAYRRGEVESARRLTSGVVCSSASSRLARDKNSTLADSPCDGVGDASGLSDCALVGSTFLYCSPTVLPTFLVQLAAKLEARRDKYRSERKEAIRKLLEMNPSATEMSERECRLLLAEPVSQQKKAETD
ncbi:hypothetical protein TGMAS_235360 [Toxoplasma gondii MAS]|uniref:Uncharacterized protein n=1 Tax=Toxoplasma gondii MAS TaxID=943118 RepID=A0A086PP16_TOXGO|nr:hypothetical protein TGMAS_235360 [Toxoplasma gondii MAS]